ncbi:Signal transduction histidine kinase [Streptosporangium canum]|uniref:histidine kinase n=1 Tax=Streptosporangium canum TaxID=324952 RepID=A0A1I3RN27_9ACTN|nr:HAMP domain-containing sensor histidine kinase [Streptosporangium canum]SFJ47262.1 Signal transduction histidine kinase [Streptosporangium canum]
MNPASLRWKIAVLVTLASAVVAAMVGLLVHRATWQRDLDIGEARARIALDRSLAPADRPGGTPDDVVTVAALPDALAAQLRPGRTVIWYGLDHRDEPWMWAAQLYGGDGRQAVSVQISMGSELLSLYALDRNMAKAALLALAGVVPLSVLAAELPNRRLRRMARTAREIADGNLAARTDAGGRDEIAEIGAGLNSMAAGLQRRLLSEQRFTADVAHELRTPMMGLMTSAELLPDGEVTDLVRDRVRVLRTLVECLLEISRLDAGAERADRVPVPVGEVVEESVQRTGLQAAVTVTGAPVAETDPRRLDRIIANLVINAHRHGRPPVEVAVEGTAVVVRDHGPGFPDELLAHGPQRFRTGAAERGQGHGLGLAIAFGQAEVIGADLTLANAPDGGAVAILRLTSPAGRSTGLTHG